MEYTSAEQRKWKPIAGENGSLGNDNLVYEEILTAMNVHIEY